MKDPMSSADARALVTAMELLAANMAGLPLQIATNVGKTAEEILEERHKKGENQFGPGLYRGENGPDSRFGPAGRGSGAGDVLGANPFLAKIGEWLGRRKEGVADTGGAMIGLLLKRFEVLLGPLAIMAQVLGSSLSGFQMLGKTVQLLVALIAPVLMPVLVALATAITAVFDVLFEKMLPVLESWFELVLTMAIPVLTLFVDMVMMAANAAKEFYDSLPEKGDLVDVLGFDMSDEEKAVQLRRMGGGSADGTPAGEIVVKALRDVTASMRLSTGPRATMGDLGGVGRSVQMAALQGDPIDARMLRVQQTMVNLLEKVVSNTTRSAGAVYAPESSRSAMEGGFAGAMRTVPAPGGSA